MDFSIVCSRMIARRVRKQFNILPHDIELDLPTKEGLLPFTVKGTHEGSAEEITITGYVGTNGDVEVMSTNPHFTFEI